MASIETLLAFSLAMAVFAYMPGPAILYTAAQTLARGRRAGFMAALGLHFGGYFHVFAAALGLSAALAYVPTVYAAIKLAGALYLVWLGIALIRQCDDDAEAPVVKMKSARKAFMESIVVEVFNPKAALFFMAFLPQFVDPAGAWPVWVQLLVLGVATLMAFTSADIVTVFAASAIAARAKAGSLMRKWLKWLGGSILIGLGSRLALTN
ncbi:MAG: LysE family translocator [Rhizobiales bacterium]|nr:LysE family translocator [Hyphomicrobiales bacterium]